MVSMLVAATLCIEYKRKPTPKHGSPFSFVKLEGSYSVALWLFSFQSGTTISSRGSKNIPPFWHSQIELARLLLLATSTKALAPTRPPGLITSTSLQVPADGAPFPSPTRMQEGAQPSFPGSS
mmetsp:Transcript_61229/g.134072  ORF Transcript_61229/g.134072 Transcript_61229/m.134072 type:complete len:123 (-) Transcript_61229:15-383(-)